MTTRKQILLKLLRHHGIRYCMVEGKYITKEDYFEEVIQVLENLGVITITEEDKNALTDTTTK